MTRLVHQIGTEAPSLARRIDFGLLRRLIKIEREIGEERRKGRKSYDVGWRTVAKLARKEARTLGQRCVSLDPFHFFLYLHFGPLRMKPNPCFPFCKTTVFAPPPPPPPPPAPPLMMRKKFGTYNKHHHLIVKFHTWIAEFSTQVLKYSSLKRGN